jgi:geranylgeranyl reductase family protein
MSDKYDVAIVGAGPAGSACALSLADKGLRVIMIDKERFPRDKVCGDAIPGKAFKAMDAINNIWGEELRKNSDSERIRTAHGFSSSGQMIELNWQLFTYNSKRIHFDEQLFNIVKNETDTKIMEGVRVTEVTDNDTYVVLSLDNGRSVKASVVVGCDGANSVTKKLVKENPSPQDVCVAVRAYYSDVEGVTRDINEFHFFKDLMPGYFWIFPVDERTVNVGFGILQTGKKKELRNLREILDRITHGDNRISERFRNSVKQRETKGFSLPLYTRKRSISGNRVLLCGDAASLIDPLWGHGIDTAMWSGHIAAGHIINAIQKNDFSERSLAAYDSDVYEKIGSNPSVNTRILKLFNRFPWLLNFFFIAGRQPSVIRFLSRFS